MRVHEPEGGRAIVDGAIADKCVQVDLLKNAFATEAPGFVNTALRHLVEIARPGPSRSPCEDTLNAGLALVDAAGPENEVEAALAVQGAGAHAVGMQMLVHARQAAHDPQRAALYTGMSTKLMRASAAAFLALDRLRRRADPPVVVEFRVTVDPEPVLAAEVEPRPEGARPSPVHHLQAQPRKPPHAA